MSLYQPELIDLCSTSDEEDWCGVNDSSYDSVLVLSEFDHPLSEVPWRFGKAARNTRVDEDEVVVMSDIRPLEPDMVDLSDSSEDSHREDEREEIMQVEDLDVAGQSKESTRGVHEADPNEIEEIGEPSSQGGGTNAENPSVLIPWSDCEGEVSSTLTVQANRENIYCQENQNAGAEPVEGAVQDEIEESIAVTGQDQGISDTPVRPACEEQPWCRARGKEWELQLEVSESREPNHEDARNTGKEVSSAIERVNSEHLKSFNQDGQEMRFGKVDVLEPCVDLSGGKGRNPENTVESEEAGNTDKSMPGKNDDTHGEGETSPAVLDEEGKDSSDRLGEAKSCEIGEVTCDRAVNDPAVDGEDVLDSPATKEELGKEKDVIDKVLPDVDKARDDADDGSQDVTQSPSDWVENVEHSQQGVGMHQKVLQGKGQTVEGDGEEIETKVGYVKGLPEPEEVFVKPFAIENKLAELAKELLADMNTMKQFGRLENRKLKAEPAEGNKGCREPNIFCGNGLNRDNTLEKRQEDDVTAETREGQHIKLKMVKMEALVKPEQAGGEVTGVCREDDTEVGNCSDGEEEIIDCLSGDEDMSEVYSEDSDDNDIEIEEVTGEFPDHKALLRPDGPNIKSEFGCSGNEAILAEDSKAKVIGKDVKQVMKMEEVKVKSKHKQDTGTEEEEEDSDTDRASWHQRLRDVSLVTLVQCQGSNTNLKENLVLETIPGLLKESEEISKPRKSSKFVKNTSSAVNKVAALAKQHFEHSSQGKEENIGKSKSKKKKRSCQIKERKSDKKAKSAGTGVKNAPTLAQVERDSRSEKISKPSSMTSTDERAIKLTPKHELKSRNRAPASLTGSYRHEGKANKSESKKSSSSFKIPKGKYQSQRLHTTGDRKVDSILAEEQISLEADLSTFLKEKSVFDTMFEAVKKLQSGDQFPLKKTRELSKCGNGLEEQDLTSEGWEEVRQLGSDKERVKKAQKEFGNPVPSDPCRNMTVHSYKRGGVRNNKRKLSEANLPFVSLSPKRISSKRIRHEDFTKVMKTVFFNKFNKSHGTLKTAPEEQVQNSIEDFKSYISHYKTAQEETADFLSYYDNKCLLERLVLEVRDTEEQFSRFLDCYGPPDSFRCDPCGRKHKFCQ